MSFYFITPEQKTFTKISNEIYFTENSNSPLLILLGWSGSTTKQLIKYYEIYRDKGFNCILLTTKLDPTGLILNIYAKKLAVMLDLYLKKNFSCNTIVSQFFSIGGNVYMWLMGILNNHQKYEYMLPKFKGQIADSSPPYTIKGCMYGIYRTMRMYGNLKGLGSITLPFFIPIYVILLKNRKYLHSPTNQMYTLVLDSKDDTLLLDSVTQFVNDLKKYIQNYDELVKVKYFTDSSHVRHYVNYPTEYRNEISIFISKILNNPSKLLINSKL